ncbi:MAG: type 4 pilus major pilin [Noviherbaspirillum sp.]
MKKQTIKQIRNTGRLSLQRGASLLEGIAYLGIAALVILGAVSLLTSAFGNAQSNRTSEETIALRTAIRKLFSGQTYPGSDTNLLPTLVAAKAVPSTLNVGANNAVTNTWSGTVAVTGQGATFTVSYANVPQDVCVNMLSGAAGWVKVKNGGVEKTSNPLSPADATDLCPAAANTVAMIGA